MGDVFREQIATLRADVVRLTGERDEARAEVERMRGLCHHYSQTIEPEGKLRCELCGAVEQDPFWRNPA